MIHLNLRKEPTMKAWAWRLLLGPAQIIEGTVHTLTLGFVVIGLSLNVARKLSLARWPAPNT